MGRRQSQQHEQLQQLQLSMHATTDIKIILNIIKSGGGIATIIRTEAKNAEFEAKAKKCVRNMLLAIAERHKV